jgi:hypothetical protein
MGIGGSSDLTQDRYLDAAGAGVRRSQVLYIRARAVDGGGHTASGENAAEVGVEHREAPPKDDLGARRVCVSTPH